MVVEVSTKAFQVSMPYIFFRVCENLAIHTVGVSYQTRQREEKRSQGKVCEMVVSTPIVDISDYVKILPDLINISLRLMTVLELGNHLC